VSLVLDTQASREGLRGDGARGLGHGRHRSQHAAREKVAAPDRQDHRARHPAGQYDAEGPERLPHRALVPRGHDVMGWLAERSHSVGGRPGRRPARRPVHDRATFHHLEVRDAHPVGQLAQIPGLFTIDLLDGRQLVFDLSIERGVETGPHEAVDPDCKGADHESEHAGMPEGEAHADARNHPCPPRTTNPTPRTVWSSLVSKWSSIFSRSRATVPSITLSSGVARAVTCHTSRASISRETTWPTWRSRYSRSSNSFTVSSTACPALVTRRVITSMVRSSSRSLSAGSGRPRRSRARIRARSSGNAKGLIR